MTDVLVFLKRIRRERHELKVVQETAAELRAMLLPSAIRYDTDKVQTSPEEHLSTYVSELVEIEQHEQTVIERLKKDIRMVEQLLERMPTQEHRLLLRLRYLSGGVRALTWEEIAEQMGYSTVHVRGYMHGKAIGEARKIWRKVNTF